MLQNRHVRLACGVAALFFAYAACGAEVQPPKIQAANAKSVREERLLESQKQTSAVSEQPAASPEFEGKVIVISSTAMPEPDFPLQFSLLPDYPSTKPGNAAPCYFRAILLMPREKEKRFGDEQAQWIDLPLEQFPKEQAHDFLKPYANSLKEIKVATHREYCEWDLQVQRRKGPELFGILLPEIQEMRQLARILRLKSRLEISEGRFDDAHETLVTGYRLSVSLSGTSVLLHELVAIAIAGVMNDSVVDWIEADGPNLFWGLASLPRPLIDIRKALQQEMNLPMQVFPFLNDPEQLSYTPQQWRQIIGESLLQMGGTTSGKEPTMAAQAMATGLILAGYSTAKQALVNGGMDAAQVEAMPVGQVVAVHSARVYRKVQHESMKWAFLPYWQSHRQMAQSFKKLRAEGYLNWGGISGTVPIAAMFLPAIESTFLAPVRMERDIAALQTIEAIRMAAAESDGKLPDSIEDLQQCPAPLDPVTGKPFAYRVEGKKAVLLLAPPEGRSAAQFGKRYELSLEE